MANLKRVKKLQVRATRGDAKAASLLSNLNDEVAIEVNKRLRALERRNYDFGAYNAPVHFTQTMYDTNRFQKSKSMDNDYELMSTQTQIGLKFLDAESSTVQGQRDIEDRRYQTFIDMGIVEEGYSKRKFKGFLRFIGNEESNAVIESWSTSEKMVEMLFDAYNKRRVSKATMLMRFREYLAGEKDLKETMKSMGVNIDDYRSLRWKEW